MPDVQSAAKPGTAKEPRAAPENPKPTRYVLVLYQGLDSSTRDDQLDMELVMRLRRLCDSVIKDPPEQAEMDVWLESPGGDAHAAYKLVVLLRAVSSRIRVIVPDYAKSAATLLTLGADEIYMAPAAELGPLDYQIPREGGVTSRISALDIARSVEDLASLAVDIAVAGGANVLRQTRLTRSESLGHMLTFSAAFFEPIVRQLDPALIHWSSTLLEVTVAYADRLLGMRAPDTPPALPRLARTLVEEYPTHGFVISRSEARDRLKLPVYDLAAYPFMVQACGRHREFEESGRNDIALIRADSLVRE